VRPRLLLGLAAIAVMFAAADTYVVVLALPDMMASIGLSVDELQRAAPIVSGFLLGYVAMLPLVGRIADLRGRVPVLVGSLVVFAIGSLVTAAAYDLPSMVVGRFVQGVGAGGLVPATLALVADLYPAERRGVPLGVVGAVQELGSVLGPLYGALVLAVADWQAIFALNLALGLVLAAAISAHPSPGWASERRVAQEVTAQSVRAGNTVPVTSPSPIRPPAAPGALARRVTTSPSRRKVRPSPKGS
jgi:MFS family permease